MSYPAVDFDSVHWVEPAPVRSPWALRISLAVAAIVSALSCGAIINAWSRIQDIDLNGTGHSPAYDQPVLEASDEAPLLASVPASPYGHDAYIADVLPASYSTSDAKPGAVPLKAEAAMTETDFQTPAKSEVRVDALTVKASDGSEADDKIVLITPPDTIVSRDVV